MKRPAAAVALAIATLACTRQSPTVAPSDAGRRADGGGSHAGRPPTVGLRRLWGLAPADLWAIGAQGLILNFDGRAWQRVPSGVTADLQAIAGRATDDAWIVGAGGTLLRLRGRTWTREDLRFDGGTPALEKVHFAAVWVAPNGTVWVGGSAQVPGAKDQTQAGLLGRYEAGRWTFDHDTECADTIEHLWGTGPDDVWAYCSGFFVHWNGRQLIKRPPGTPPQRRGRHGFAGGWREVGTQGGPRLTHPARPMAPIRGDHGFFSDFWAFGTDNVWVIRPSEIYHFDGRAWTALPPPR